MVIHDNEILKAIQYKLETFDMYKPVLEPDLKKVNDLSI